jgi:hypothetical protein
LKVKPKTSIGVLIPKDKMPRSRIYPDRYQRVWDAVSVLTIDKSYMIPLSSYKNATVNALRCATQRVKRQGRIPADVRVSSDGKNVYFYRA